MKDPAFVYPKGRFVFKGAANKVGKRILYLQYTVEQRPVFRTTGIPVSPSNWDSRKQIIRKSEPDAEKLNDLLHARKCNSDLLVERHCREGNLLTISTMKRILEGTYEPRMPAARIDFFQYAENLYKMRYESQEISWKTYYGSQSMFRSFKKFCVETRRDPVLPLGAIDVDLINRYKRWCVEAGNQIQSINKKLVPISVTVKYAADNDLLPRSIAAMVEGAYYPEKKKRYGSGENPVPAGEEDVNYLTDEMMDRLLDFYGHVRRRDTRDYIELFLFSFHACGMRISDLVTLEWGQVDLGRGVIVKELVKTKTPITVPLNEPAVKILTHWKKRRLNRRFVFNLLPEDFSLKDDAALSRAIDYKNRAIRTSLNAVGEKIGVPFKLGMHVARHTFAVKALNTSGISIHMISRLLGHSSVLVTEKVYAKFLTETLTKEVREKLSFPEYGISY